MKTIEEKAKAYDEAFERFKSFKEKYYTEDTNLGDVIFDKTGEMQKDFEQIFPELRESEDEKIRKEIIKFIQDFCNPCDPDCDKWIAYLEKKEQKPVERATMRDFNYHEGESDEKAWSRLFAILNYAEATSDDTPEEEIQALTNWIEGKQKPAWSEEEERILKGVIGKIDHDQTYGVSKAEMLSFLKRLRPQMNPIVAVDAEQLLKILPKRQEWSEEDEDAVRHICRYLGYHCNEATARGCTKWLNVRLKSLRPQPKQECSEENELNTCPHYSDGYGCDISPMKKCESCEHRPSWKPSEEQMEVLKEAVAYFGDSLISQKQKILESLYNDLLKLK